MLKVTLEKSLYYMLKYLCFVKFHVGEVWKVVDYIYIYLLFLWFCFQVKHFIDFLSKEGFIIEQIAAKPRILASSQKTVKKRLERLRQLGVNDINLNLLCRSKKDFERVCETLAVMESVNK